MLKSQQQSAESWQLIKGQKRVFCSRQLCLLCWASELWSLTHMPTSCLFHFTFLVVEDDLQRGHYCIAILPKCSYLDHPWQKRIFSRIQDLWKRGFHKHPRVCLFRLAFNASCKTTLPLNQLRKPLWKKKVKGACYLHEYVSGWKTRSRKRVNISMGRSVSGYATRADLRHRPQWWIYFFPPTPLTSEGDIQSSQGCHLACPLS